MTHDVLQSDIELARRLRGDQRSDEEIIRALVHRGVNASTAAQLVDDLRSGKNVTAQSPAPQEFNLRRRSRPRSRAPEVGESPSAHPPAAAPRNEPPAHRSSPRRTSSRVFRQAFLVLVGLALLVVVVVAFLRYRTSAVSDEKPGPASTSQNTNRSSAESPAKTAIASQKDSATRLVLELQPDGLHLGGSLVTRDNLLPVVTHLLGAPTRTNQVAQTGTLVYAYDHQGLLIYSQPGGGTNSIVLDCDAIGGINGTTSPFAGLLRMEDRIIGPDMDSATLTAIKELGLKHPGGGGSVWNGQYHGLDLVFAFLKSPRHLSLIEIDLK